jgi:hypothetical protein
MTSLENMLYFAEGGAANATTEAACYPASSFTGVAPISTTTTRIYFESPINDVDSGGGAGDYIEVTHNNTTASTGHRCQIIAKAMAEAVNAGPHMHGVMIDVLDFDNAIYFSGLKALSSDTSFGISVNLDS